MRPAPTQQIGFGSGSTMHVCPNCRGSETKVFHEVSNVPVHSVLLMRTREYALQFRRGDIKLGFCEGCGFVSNTAFDPGVHEYSEQYEETQGFSGTFQAFHRRLAQTLIEKYDIRGKRIIEIGCGKGEFLTLLCELGDNTGVGFDPAFVPERNPARDPARLTFIQDFYSEKYNADVAADVICCKMTLEHIPDTYGFVETVRSAIGDRRDTLVFFQVPNFEHILRQTAFWDIYYEHCSYFTSVALRALFEGAGFDVIALDTEYGEQYLQIFALPADRALFRPTGSGREVDLAKSAVNRFADASRKRITAWNNMFKDLVELRMKAVLWGSGSKAVAFLSAVEDPALIEYVVDINPYRHGHYMPGTGQLIVAPEFLAEYAPDIVVAMNPIYRAEIQKTLSQVGCKTRLLSV